MEIELVHTHTSVKNQSQNTKTTLISAMKLDYTSKLHSKKRKLLFKVDLTTFQTLFMNYIKNAYSIFIISVSLQFKDRYS